MTCSVIAAVAAAGLVSGAAAATVHIWSMRCYGEQNFMGLLNCHVRVHSCFICWLAKCELSERLALGGMVFAMVAV